LPHLRRSGSGRIINVTSVAVKADRRLDAQTPLASSRRLGETLSWELAPEGITVNNICLGNIATERLTSHRGARQAPEESLEEAVALEEAASRWAISAIPTTWRTGRVLRLRQARFITALRYRWTAAAQPRSCSGG
jgi:NAD(P)-dependent dehydrogenase (short-subunit alcohol dehydrogenase family)